MPIGETRESRDVAILRMLDDRNAAVHVYDEGLAKTVAQRVPNYSRLLRTWIEGSRAVERRSPFG